MRHTLVEMNNVCGWCDTTSAPMLGSPDGPRGDQTCSRWIWKHQDCPVYRCMEDWTFVRIVGLILPPLGFGLAWLYAELNRAHPRQPELPHFLQRKFTFAEFSKGLGGSRQTMRSTPFQSYFPFAPRLSHLILQMMRNTLLTQSLIHSLRLGFFMSLFYQALHISPAVLDNIQYKVLKATLEDGKRLSSALKVSVGILFSFYALGRVGWWWTVIDWCRNMQGRTHDIGLIIGGYTAVKECPQAGKASKKEQWLEAKWNLYRFIMLSWIMCYRSLSADFKLIELGDLVDAGLLEPSEKAIISECAHGRKAPLKWISTWVGYHVKDVRVRALVLDKLCALRGTMGGLHDACELRAPMSFEGLMYTLVVAWVYSIPFQRLVDIDDRKVVLEQGVVIPTLTSICTCIFYMFILALLETFKDPFGLSKDALSVETIFLETETTTWDYLTVPAPACLEHTLCSERLTLPRVNSGVAARPTLHRLGTERNF